MKILIFYDGDLNQATIIPHIDESNINKIIKAFEKRKVFHIVASNQIVVDFSKVKLLIIE